ncbi:MAG TPA: hypothetical protein PLR41_14710 [Alphaproteobacteria bacterium]|nr:hypothetical protein [Alphaproteobacteria bacterium]
MPTKIDFRDCVHQGIAGPTPDHILASIRAEYCMPRDGLPALRGGKPLAAPAIQLEDFAALAQALGQEAFRQLIGDVLRHRDPGATLAQLPDFLTRHRYGHATPALIDLARLERAIAECERAPVVQSVGLCCLPPELVRAHPDLTLALHPAWRWLDLAAPVDRWRAALLHGAAMDDAPAPRRVRLRVHPRQDGVAVHRLTAVEFAFETALQGGASLRRAEADARAAGADGAAFAPLRHLQTLLLAGAVVGAQLHPHQDAARPRAHSTETSSSSPANEVMP